MFLVTLHKLENNLRNPQFVQPVVYVSVRKKKKDSSVVQLIVLILAKQNSWGEIFHK